MYLTASDQVRSCMAGSRWLCSRCADDPEGAEQGLPTQELAGIHGIQAVVQRYTSIPHRCFMGRTELMALARRPVHEPLLLLPTS
jgi:hypothetical protein